MRPFVDWFVVALVLITSAAYTLRRADAAIPARYEVVETEASSCDLWPAFVVPLVEVVLAPPISRPDETWCEPVGRLACDPDVARSCPTAPDGTPMKCARDWYDDSGGHVCVAGYPSRDVRRWRANRLRILVDEICKRGDGCNPRALHGYLSALILRESTWRPYKVHRLAGDLDANIRAWQRHAELYRDSPAASDPARWSAGRGYFGANAAAVLHVWDAAEIPEALCGEVESVIVHLRTARRMWRRVDDGVTCSGREHRGTAVDGVSWYDVSLANSGSNACPGKSGRRLAVRHGFERRARSQEINPYGRVTSRMLGRSVPRSEQRAFADRVRRKMDRLYPTP